MNAILKFIPQSTFTSLDLHVMNSELTLSISTVPEAQKNPILGICGTYLWGTYRTGTWKKDIVEQCQTENTPNTTHTWQEWQNRIPWKDV